MTLLRALPDARSTVTCVTDRGGPSTVVLVTICSTYVLASPRTTENVSNIDGATVSLSIDQLAAPPLAPGCWTSTGTSTFAADFHAYVAQLPTVGPCAAASTATPSARSTKNARPRGPRCDRRISVPSPGSGRAG